MFDIDSGKLLIVAVLALIVIGPKELPRVLRQVGQSVGKLRRMAGEFQGQFMDAMKEADIADIRKDLDDISKSAALDVHFDPARDIQAELTSVMQPASVLPEVTPPSPAAGFDLPAAVSSEGVGSVAAGIAPLAEGAEPEPVATTIDAAPTVPALPDGPALGSQPAEVSPLSAPHTQAKRKILVKRRTSRLASLRPDDVANRTGEPVFARRRVVRAKTPVAESVPTA